MKNNLVVILLVVLIGVLSGLGLLFGISNAVSVAVAPLSAKLERIEAKLSSGHPGGSSDMAARLDAITNKLAQVDQKLNAPPEDPSAQEPPQEDYDKVYTINAGTSPVAGKKDAPVTIVKFTDLQCPFCGRFFPAIKEVLKEYPDQVNVIIKNFPLPFHPNARPAAKLALAADAQGKYIEMVEVLMNNGAAVTDDKIKEYAQKLGIDAAKLADDYKNKDAQWEAQIQEDEQLAQEADVRGTPTFFINGKKTMARDFGTFKAAIDKILQEKK